MKKLKVFSLILLSFVLVFTLAACGGNNSSNSSNNGGSSVSTPANEPANTPADEPEEAVVETPDLGGRVIKLAAWWDDTPVGDTAGGIARLDKIAELEQKYNMKIEFINIPFEEYMDNFTTSVLAGEPFADVAVMEYKRAIVPVKDGLVLPLSEFTSGISDVNNEQRLVTKLPPLGGDEYSFGKVGVSVVGIHYNRELFTRLGLPDPQELYAKGEWTWDKYLEIAKAATRDEDNDGKIDVWGTSGWPADTARHFGVTNDAKFVNDEDFTEGISDPKMIETLEFVNRLVNVENVNKVKTGNKMDWNETRTFKDGDVAMAIMYDWDLGDVTFDFGLVPIPKGPSGSGKWGFANTALNGWFIPKGVKDPAIVYQIFEEMQDVPPTEEYVGQDWLESRYKHESDIRMALDHINGTGAVSIEEGVPDHPFYAIMDEIIVQEQSVTATVEKYKDQFTAVLEKLN